MIESRNDLILRIVDEIAFLTVRLAGMQAMGLSEEILHEVERLEQASGKLDEEDRNKVELPLGSLRAQVRNLRIES